MDFLNYRLFENIKECELRAPRIIFGMQLIILIFPKLPPILKIANNTSGSKLLYNLDIGDSVMRLYYFFVQRMPLFLVNFN